MEAIVFTIAQIFLAKHLLHSPSLDTRGKAETRATQEHLHRTVEGELKTLHHTWGTVQKLAQKIQEWGTFVAALHASWHNGQQ